MLKTKKMNKRAIVPQKKRKKKEDKLKEPVGQTYFTLQIDVNDLRYQKTSLNIAKQQQRARSFLLKRGDLRVRSIQIFNFLIRQIRRRDGTYQADGT